MTTWLVVIGCVVALAAVATIVIRKRGKKDEGPAHDHPDPDPPVRWNPRRCGGAGAID